MKIFALCAAALATCGFMGAEASADLAFIPDIPSTDVLISRGDEAALGGGGSQATFGFRNADAAGTDGTRARGQSFLFSTGGTVGDVFDISSFNVSLAGGAGNAVRPDGQLEFTVFEWQGTTASDFATWDTSTGGVYSSGHTELFRESFAVAAGTQILGTNLVEISLNQGELQLTEGTNYGFLFNYTLDNNGTGLSTDVTIAFDADLNAPDNAPGQLLNTNLSTSFATADNGVSSTRDLNYFITGTQAVPEPTSMTLLGLGTVALVARRRRK